MTLEQYFRNAGSTTEIAVNLERRMSINNMDTVDYIPL